MPNFKQIFTTAIFLSLLTLSAAFVTAQRQTDLTVKEASIVKQPITSRANEIKVIVANNDKNKADKVSVTVYALPETVIQLFNVTFYSNVEYAIQNGTLNESNFLDYFGSKPSFYKIIKLKDKAAVEQFINIHSKPSSFAWAQSSQEISLEPNASQTLKFAMSSNYAPPVTGNEKQDKVHKIIKLLDYHSPFGNAPGELFYLIAAPKKLTFGQSVFYVEVKGGVDKNEKDNSYFIAQQLLQLN